MSLSFGKKSCDRDGGKDDKKTPAGRKLAPPDKVAVPLKPPMKPTPDKPAPSIAAPGGGTSVPAGSSSASKAPVTTGGSLKPVPDKSVTGSSPAASRSATAGGATSGSAAPIYGPAAKYPKVVPPGHGAAGRGLTADVLSEYENMTIGKTPSQSGSSAASKAPTPAPKAPTPVPSASAADPASHSTSQSKSGLDPRVENFAPGAPALGDPGILRMLAAREERLMAASHQQEAAYANPTLYGRTATGRPVMVAGGVAQIQGYNGVFIKNLPKDARESEILDVFSQAGTIVTHSFPRDDKGKSKGFASIKFETVAEAKAALDTFNNRVIRGRSIEVMVDKTSQIYAAPGPSAPVMPPPHPGARIRIKNIHPRTLYYSVEFAMEVYGAEPGKVKLLPDPRGTNTQVAVVEFPSTVEANQVVQGLRTVKIDGTEVEARIMGPNE